MATSLDISGVPVDKPFRFLDLPREIRDLVYENLCGIYGHSPRGIFWSRYGQRSPVQQSGCVKLDIFCVNRQISGEAASRIFSMIEFWYTVTTVDEYDWWCNGLDIYFHHALRNVQKVHLTINASSIHSVTHEHDPERCSCPGFYGHLDTVLECLRSAPKILELTVEFWQRWKMSEIVLDHFKVIKGLKRVLIRGGGEDFKRQLRAALEVD